MFTKGPRFEPFKAPDVPGPNAYIIPQESALDSYKRGAFLEKTDRFVKEKPSQSAPSNKPSQSKPPPPHDRALSEKYHILQRKVEELEKVHLEDKKVHHVELGKLKEELALSQKLATESADKLEKQKKQNSSLELRIQELKKDSASEQSELKELRHKVRMLELERDKVSSKQPEILELKKSLSALETKRKDELRERDKRIHETEDLLQNERKKRVSLEKKVQDLQEETGSLRAAALEFEARVQQARKESQNATEEINKVQGNASVRENNLIEQVEQLRCLLRTAAEQYGNLVAHSVPAVKHHTLQRDLRSSRLRQYRLERKLANSEGQVIELTHLIRQIKQQNSDLHIAISDALSEISCLSVMDYAHPVEDARYDLSPYDLNKDIQEDRLELLESDLISQTLLLTYYRLKTEELYSRVSNASEVNSDIQRLAEQRASDLNSALASHEAIASRLESIQKENLDITEKLGSANTLTIRLNSTIAQLQSKLAEAEEETRRSGSQHAVALKKEKDIANRLTLAVQKNRAAEDALRAEIEQLTSELTDAERYQEAYFALSDEVTRLITRNQIAEEESERISRFNAEILGHNNPAQRIMYVDRIRRELAEAKHTIALLSREQDDILAQKEDLQHEIDMYKSVQVPLHNRPRTHITRIVRPPLVDLEINSNSTTSLGKSASKIVSNGEADMTVDELI